jgi:clan AA aspartic protease
VLEGTVNSRFQPLVSLTLYGKENRSMVALALVDSGCNDILILSHELIQALRAEYVFDQDVRVASGEIVLCPVHRVQFQWGETIRTAHASVLGSGHEAILGMQALQGHRVEIEAEIGGVVRITPL